MNWKRIVGWSLLIFVAGVAVGLSLSDDTLSTVGIFASSAILYCFYLRPLAAQRFRHLAVAFLLVEALDWIVPMMLGAPLSFLLENWDSFARHLGAALLGWLLARLSSNNSFKRTPLRGAA